MEDIPWTDKRDHKYWYTIKCPCGAEGEIGLPIEFRGTFGCPDDEGGCMATYIQWDSPEGIRVKCVVEPCYESDEVLVNGDVPIRQPDIDMLDEPYCRECHSILSIGHALDCPTRSQSTSEAKP